MKKILIADDEPDILKVVRFRLIKAGYEITVVCDGKEAVEAAGKIMPDLVLLDYSMPFLNGDEVCRILKSDPKTKHIPIILMTASTKKVEEEHVRSAGIDDSILKPFEPEQLFEKIEKLIG